MWQLYKGANALEFDPNYPSNSVSGIRLIELIDQTNGNRTITPSNAYYLSPWPTFSETAPKRPDGLPDPYKITQAISKSKDSYDVRKLIFQLGHSLNWVNLYSVLDTLEHIGKAKWSDVKKVAGVTDAQIKSFTGTANNFGILGINARHGERGWASPKSTIDLLDAQFIILSLSNAYLDVYHNIKLTTKFSDYEAAKKIKAAKTADSDFLDMDF